MSVAATAEQIPEKYDGALLEVLLFLSKQSLSTHLSRKFESQIPKNAILSSAAHLAKTSKANTLCERYKRNGMLSQIFGIYFTGEVECAFDEIVFFLNQSILFIVSAMSTAGKRSNTILTSLCNAIATYS